jgi:hypothetical protein
MASAPVKKTTVGNLAAGLFIGLAILFDSLKIILLFVDAIPLIGAPIGFLGSWVISFFEFISITLGLYIAGAYKGKNSAVSGLITVALGTIDFVPLLDDFPFTTGGVITIITRSRFNDAAEYKIAVAKYKAEQKAEEEQRERESRAIEAQSRAAAQRQQAMAASLASVANDNARLSQAA